MLALGTDGGLGFRGARVGGAVSRAADDSYTDQSFTSDLLPMKKHGKNGMSDIMLLFETQTLDPHKTKL